MFQFPWWVVSVGPSIPHLSESDCSVILHSYSVVMRHKAVSGKFHLPYTHTHTHTVELVGNWDFLPTLSKKLNKVRWIRDIKHIIFPSPLCQQGLLWIWTSTPTWQEQDWTTIVIHSSTLPWYQWELFTHTGHQWGRGRWHFTSPFPLHHWIGEGKQQGGRELSSCPTLQHQSRVCQSSIFPSLFHRTGPQGEKRQLQFVPTLTRKVSLGVKDS